MSLKTFCYIIASTSLFGFLYHLFIPKGKPLKYTSLARGYYSKTDEYDWAETLRRHRIFLLVLSLISALFAIIFDFIPDKLNIIGVFILIIVSIILSIWVGPVKKEKM